MSKGLWPIKIRLSVSREQIKRAFEDADEGLRDLTPAMEKVKGILAAMFVEVFGSEGTALGKEQWSQLSKVYAERKQRLGITNATLKLTGQLLASLGEAEGGFDSIRSIRRRSGGLPKLFFGTRLPYAPGLNYGEKQRRRMPARPFIGITQQAAEETTSSIQELLQERLNRLGAALSAEGT
ncbi:MAG TPA: hypothetical protein VKU80_15520 [Planctomycetota bacterium]|nr:hypothetical protein [Planctomycetota bacterium]